MHIGNQPNNYSFRDPVRVWNDRQKRKITDLSEKTETHFPSKLSIRVPLFPSDVYSVSKVFKEILRYR